MTRTTLVALGFLVTGCVARAVYPNVKPVAASAGDWQPLFNGRDLEGWTPVGTALWRVEDGVIVGGQEGDPKRAGVLATRSSYKDFELELEFLIDEHGKYNSGVYLRNTPGESKRTGYQVNIGRAAAGEFCGGIYTDKWLARGDDRDAVRKPLGWNSMHIRAEGPHVVVTLNGIEVANFTDTTPDPKFLAPGVIAFQTYGAEGHSGFVKLRNLRLRPLAAR